ncbi:acyl-CoA dehydrogenase family protein [Kocuria rhizophila]|nr:acyl-CoA dehydrogenase family protein [Kocuria rhizophila]
MQTFARKDGEDWVINGAKRWIGLASVAKVAVIWRRLMTVSGVLVIPTSTPGFKATPITAKC